jgi:hypothetical protein
MPILIAMDLDADNPRGESNTDSESRQKRVKHIMCRWK